MPTSRLSPDQYPVWYDGKCVNEVEFSRVFLTEHPMRCINGRLFTLDGAVENETLIRRMITECLQSVIVSGLVKRSATLLDCIRLAAYAETLPLEMDRGHLSNGVWYIDGRFEQILSFCNNRLQVSPMTRTRLFRNVGWISWRIYWKATIFSPYRST